MRLLLTLHLIVHICMVDAIGMEVARVVESETFGANVNVTTYRLHAYLWLTPLVWRLSGWVRVKHLVLM